MEHFGERLKKAREKQGLTQLQVAKALANMGVLVNCKCDVVGKYERGLMYPNAHRMHDLCVILGVSADYLLGLSDKEDLK